MRTAQISRETKETRIDLRLCLDGGVVEVHTGIGFFDHMLTALAFYGGLTATAVEYAVHFLYDKLLGVMFWDYSGTHMDLNRRVCVPFAVIWGPLTAFALRQVQPLLHPIALHAPAGAGLALLLVLTADSFFTVRLLRRTHDVDLLGLPNLLASLR